jgi:hypothetical protein
MRIVVPRKKDAAPSARYMRTQQSANVEYLRTCTRATVGAHAGSHVRARRDNDTLTRACMHTREGEGRGTLATAHRTYSLAPPPAPLFCMRVLMTSGGLQRGTMGGNMGQHGRGNAARRYGP